MTTFYVTYLIQGCSFTEEFFESIEDAKTWADDENIKACGIFRSDDDVCVASSTNGDDWN